jgi:ATP-dependent DNA helicase PIF1
MTQRRGFALKSAAAPYEPHLRWPVGVKPSREFQSAVTAASEKDNLFITGRAGTGKSTLLRCLRANLQGRSAVLAPTGLAAINVQGQTIHSFFGFPPQFITPEVVKRARRTALLRNLDTLIIDEISMVRADLMEGIDLALRIARKQTRVPFGGVQVLLLGDLHQLPPIVREPELQTLFAENFGGFYFFNAPVFRDAPLSLVELQHVYRQSDGAFLQALNGIRNGEPTREDLDTFNARVAPFRSLPNSDDYVILTPINQAADQTNRAFLDQLSGAPRLFEATVTGKFEPSAFPTDAALTLKEGSKVVLLRNDPDKRWVNGTQARIKRIKGESVWIEIDGEEHELEPATWENIRYEHDPDKDRIVEQVVGSFRQLPVRLAWALTIHKSQGMTLDKVYIDFGRGAFAHGQAYVALSRCRSLEGLALARPVSRYDIKFDERILAYRSLFPALRPDR